MKIYTIHLNQKLPNPLENIVFIKEGFSWCAGLFGIFCTLYHKMWLLSFILLAFEVVLALLQEKSYISQDITNSLNFGLMLIIGFNFNDLYRVHLANKGFTDSGIVSGKNEDEACYKTVAMLVQNRQFKTDQV